ncbi:MAG: hypothetical protein GF346_01630 [Candidatus Eisenbacteria bacterium]|nr:hypothetical protein [Candidatus Latescibacterota bacterium]MBD3301131.1 hypothetical protein [Candidatus Eisenbacteria bacterium]
MHLCSGSPRRPPAAGTSIVTGALFALACPCLSADVHEIHGVRFADTMSLEGRELTLRGLAVKEVTIFKLDVYAVGLYCAAAGPDGGAWLAPEASKALVLEFLRDVDRERLAAGWVRDLARPPGTMPCSAELGSLEGRDADKAVLSSFVGDGAPPALREDLLHPLPGHRTAGGRASAGAE